MREIVLVKRAVVGRINRSMITGGIWQYKYRYWTTVILKRHDTVRVNGTLRRVDWHRVRVKNHDVTVTDTPPGGMHKCYHADYHYR